MTDLGHCFFFFFPHPFPCSLPITVTTMYALDYFLVGVSTSFSGHVFLDTSLGVRYTHICSFRYSYTLNLIFQFCSYIGDNV
jgi:hypothetical protein